MADDDELEEEDDDDEDGEESPKSSKKKLIIVVGVALLVVVGGVAAAYFTGLMQPLIDMIGGTSAPAAEGDKKGAAKEPVFYDLPEILVNLNTGTRKATYLKIRVSLELENNLDIPEIEKRMPRIIDNFQVYLRELRVDDLKGSAGMYRLREELLSRVSAAVAPAKINDVLFKEMLVQ